MFCNKKPLTSEEYADLSAKILRHTSEIEGLKFAMEKLDMSHQNLRGIVSRKIQKRYDESAEDDIRQELEQLKAFFGLPQGETINKA